jgi:hypothetical protein
VPVHEPALGSRSSLVDLVDAEGDPLRITYRRSTDAGVTWSSPVALSTKVDDRTAPSIAHVAHQVTIAWRDPSTKRIWIRTSLDDGGTFQPPTALSASSSVPYVAIGGSTSFVVFNDTTGRLRLRRSFDGGKTWPGSTPIAYLRSDNLSDFGVAAAGSVSVITYDTPTLKVVARRSGNGGASYGPATRVGAPVPGASYQPSQFFGPRVTARPGVWTLVYTDGGQGNAFIRASTDGARTWSTPQAVPSTFGVRGYDLGGHLVMLDLYAGLDCNVRFRTWRR